MASTLKLMLAMLATANGVDVILQVTNLVGDDSDAGATKQAVYWTHDQHLGAHDEDFYERLLNVLVPDESVMHQTHFGHAFVVRGSDLKTRFKVDVDANPNNDGDLPFLLRITNLSADEEDAQIEVGQADGFKTLSGTHTVTHATTAEHAFEIHDHNKKPVTRLELFYPNKSEL